MKSFKLYSKRGSFKPLLDNVAFVYKLSLELVWHEIKTFEVWQKGKKAKRYKYKKAKKAKKVKIQKDKNAPKPQLLKNFRQAGQKL